MMFIAVFQTLNGSDDKCLRVDHSAIWLTPDCKFLMSLWSQVKTFVALVVEKLSEASVKIQSTSNCIQC